MRTKRKPASIAAEIISLIFCCIIFLIPFYFMVINALKAKKEANKLTIAWPGELHFENFLEVLKTNNGMLVRGIRNSTIIALCSVVLIVLLASMLGYAIQRRNDAFAKAVNAMLLMGMMIPPAIIPTIKTLQFFHLFATLPGMILVFVVLNLPFSTTLVRGYVASIPSQLEESALIDGASALQIFVRIILPLMKPVISTIIILDAVAIFNDFTNPMYFLPGSQNTTAQQTLLAFFGAYTSSYNLVFASALLITLPMFVLFLIFNKRIVDGMTAGAVKG